MDNGVIIRVLAGEHELVFIHKKYNNLTPPTGKIEEGESPLETALRELKEEVNLTPRTIKSKGPIKFGEYEIFYFEVNIIDVEEVGPTNMEPNKHTNMQWINTERMLLEESVSPLYRKFFEVFK